MPGNVFVVLADAVFLTSVGQGDCAGVCDLVCNLLGVAKFILGCRGEGNIRLVTMADIGVDAVDGNGGKRRQVRKGDGEVAFFFGNRVVGQRRSSFRGIGIGILAGANLGLAASDNVVQAFTRDKVARSHGDLFLGQRRSVVGLASIAGLQGDGNRGNLEPAVFDFFNRNVAVLGGTDIKAIRSEVHRICECSVVLSISTDQNVFTRCLGFFARFQGNSHVIMSSTTFNGVGKTNHFLCLAVVLFCLLRAGDGDGDPGGVILRDGQCAGFIRDLVVVLVRTAGRGNRIMSALGVIASICTSDRVGQLFVRILAFDHAGDGGIKGWVSFGGLLGLVVSLYRDFCIVDLELCFCLGGVRSGRAFRCVLEGDGNGVLIRFGDTVLVRILHVGAGRRSGRGRPCAGGLTCLDRVGIVRTTDCHLDLDIDELVLRAVRKAVCLRGNIAKDIKAGTVVGLFGFLRENISRCRNLYEHLGVRNLDDFQAILICDACTIVRRLRTTVVVVLNSEFDDELLAVRFAILINTAPVVREVKTSNCDRVILILGCYACRCSGGGFKQSIGLIIRNRQRDTPRICRDSEVAGNLINNQCFFAERGRVSADFFVDRFKNVAERTGAGGCKVKTLIFAEVFIDRISHSHARCSRIVGRNKVHEAVGIRGFGFITINAPVVRFRIIRRKCSRIANRRTVEDTDGVDGSLVSSNRCFCVRDCVVCCRMAVTRFSPLAILTRTAIREDDHHAGTSSIFKLVCCKDAIRGLNAFVNIGGAACLQIIYIPLQGITVSSRIHRNKSIFYLLSAGANLCIVGICNNRDSVI